MKNCTSTDTEQGRVLLATTTISQKKRDKRKEQIFQPGEEIHLFTLFRS